MNKDWCTKFPDNWYVWTSNWKWEKQYIGDICKDHDDVGDPRGGCDSTTFAKGLWNRKVVGAGAIFIVASIACWMKYPISMTKRI